MIADHPLLPDRSVGSVIAAGPLPARTGPTYRSTGVQHAVRCVEGANLNYPEQRNWLSRIPFTESDTIGAM